MNFGDRKRMMNKTTYRIGDLVRYYDAIGAESKSVGTIIGKSEATQLRTSRVVVEWFNWCATGPHRTVEYGNELEVISGESK